MEPPSRSSLVSNAPPLRLLKELSSFPWTGMTRRTGNDHVFGRCGASYSDLFLAPFKPWTVAEDGASTGGAARGFLEADDVTDRTWAGLPEGQAITDECTLDLTQSGLSQGVYGGARGRQARALDGVTAFVLL